MNGERVVNNEIESPYPEFFPVRQNFQQHAIADIPAAVGSTVQKSPLMQIQSGQRVAIAVGSRGIANLKTIVACVVEQVRELSVIIFGSSHCSAQDYFYILKLKHRVTL